jgi:hypothetical protein
MSNTNSQNTNNLPENIHTIDFTSYNKETNVTYYKCTMNDGSQGSLYSTSAQDGSVIYNSPTNNLSDSNHSNDSQATTNKKS